ncbi:MAG: permease [bacterium]
MFKWLADKITYDLLRLTPGSRVGESVNFFFYDLPKIYVMLLTIMFVIAVLRSFIPPRKIRQILSHRHAFIGNILAAGFGVLTPFCTCSAIPLFIGMLESGVPLGVTMSFLISSPTVNEIALVLLWGLFGWKIALTYVASGLTIAVVCGFIIGRLKMEKYLEEIVFKTKTVGETIEKQPNWQERFTSAYEYTIAVFRSVWFYVLFGVGLGSLIHGYVPVGLVIKYAGTNNPLAVIIAVILGVPLYANCAGALPVVQAILEKGLPLGTSLAFMMSVTALSFPEFIILRKVMKPQLLFTFIGMVATGIILIGYFFNLVF